MDATPDTLVFADRVRTIYETAGGNQVNTVKIIAIIREPVSRELSLYNHLAFDCRCLGVQERTGWHNQVVMDDDSIMSFDEFVLEKSIPALLKSSGPGQSTRHGLYEQHLRKWFKLFNRKQILVLSYDELKAHPSKIQERIQSFLRYRISGVLRRSNHSDSKDKVRDPSSKTKELLGGTFAPFNEELYKLLDLHSGPPMEQQPFPRF